MATIKKLISYLETIAPAIYQESYDNSGLICGDPNTEITNVIVSLDAIESVLDEAIAKGANIIVSHHPIVFSGIKKFKQSNYVHRVVMKAIKHDIALYAIHTNLDNVLHKGVNGKIAELLGLQLTETLVPKSIRKQVQIQVSNLLKPEVKKAIESLFADSAHQFKYRLQETEKGLLLIAPNHLMPSLSSIFTHYRLDYYINEVNSNFKEIGSGLIGELPLPLAETDFLNLVKSVLHLSVIKHTALLGKSISKVAICGGSGSFLLPNALAARADIYITGDFKYHEFFDADNKLIIADVGHFESEQFTIQLLCDLINEKFSNFAAHCTEMDTNPVHYYL